MLCACECCTRDEIDWVRWQLPQYVTCLLSSERDAEDKSESDGDSDDDDEEYVEGSLYCHSHAMKNSKYEQT